MMRPHLRVLLLAATLPLAACGSTMLTESGTGGSGPTGGTGGGSGGTGGGVGGSPGAVTFVLDVPPPGSFCDEISCSTPSSPHLTITTASGQNVDLNQGFCSVTDCDTCQALACPAIAVLCPATQGVAYTGGTWTWDGAYQASSTCGPSHVSCAQRTYAKPGHYVAHFCATPGSVVQGDAALPMCVPAGPTACTDMAFDFPATSPVTLTLVTADVGKP